MEKNSILGATPIDDISGLIPRHIITRDDLYDLEFANINQAIKKYFLDSISDKLAPFTVEWLFQVHKEMLGEVWEWAGKQRTRELNIGSAPHLIVEHLKQFVDDLEYWEEEKRNFVEISAHIHHRLTKVHPFKDGNGRWSRLVTNIYLHKHKNPLLQWPKETLTEGSPFRKEYIKALKNADNGNYDTLIRLHNELLLNQRK